MGDFSIQAKNWILLAHHWVGFTCGKAPNEGGFKTCLLFVNHLEWSLGEVFWLTQVAAALSPSLLHNYILEVSPAYPTADFWTCSVKTRTQPGALSWLVSDRNDIIALFAWRNYFEVIMVFLKRHCEDTHQIFISLKNNPSSAMRWAPPSFINTESVSVIWLTNELYDPAKEIWQLLPNYSVITVWDEGFDLVLMQREFYCVCH